MNKIEKIRKEIERLKSTNPSEYNYQNAEGYVWALDDLLSFLDTLSEEPDKSLEEKTCKGFEEEFRRFIKKEKEKEPDKSLPYYGDYGIYRVARHFAQWGADHAPLPEDTVIFNKGVAEGKRLMLEEAVEGFVATHLTSEGTKITVNSDYLPKEICIKPGEKVRIIIVKEK